MRTKTLLRSFAGGEITPELFGRVELAKFQTGLLKARNFITLPHGPAARRPGFKYVAQARFGPANGATFIRLLPFEFSNDQTLVLEFGPTYLRFHSNGAPLLESARAIIKASESSITLNSVGTINSGDWVFLSLVANGARFGPFVAGGTGGNGATIPLSSLDGLAAQVPDGVLRLERVYTISTPYLDPALPDLHYAQSADVMTIVHPSYPAQELRRLGATNWTLTPISFAPALLAPATVTATATVAVNQNLTTQRYVVTAIDKDLSESLPSIQASANNNLGLAGNFNTITWSAVTGAERYNIYKLRGGVFGFIGTTTSLSIVDDNILPDTAKAPPTETVLLNNATGNYPGTVTYHEQRRCFAGTTNKPQTIFMTRTGTESNLTTSIPSQADDALEFRVASTQQNRIQHLSPLSDLLCLTSGAEFRIYSENAPAITPSSLTVKPTGYTGANTVQPVLTSGSVLHVQAQGSRLRELSYGGSQESFAYKSVDLSILATHLFNGFTIRDLAYSRAPDQLVWAVRNDGRLLGMTYVPEQQVYGWHQHDTTNGSFLSVCTVTEGNEEVLYASVRRTLGGRNVITVERMQSRIFVDAKEGFFVDCGMTYRGAPADTILGLDYLNGETVDILADGAVEARQVVTNGRVVLSGPASVVHIGLPMTSDLVTLPAAMENMPAAGQGTRKNVTDVHLRVISSALVKAGPTFDRLTVFPAREVTDNYGSPPALRTSELTIMIEPTWGTDGSVCVRQDQPLPLTVASMSLEINAGG